MGGQMDTAGSILEDMVGRSMNDAYASPGSGFGKAMYGALYGTETIGARGWLMNPGGVLQNPGGLFGERVNVWAVFTWVPWGSGSGYGIVPAGTAICAIPEDMRGLVSAVRDALGWLILGLCGVGAVRVVIEGAGGG